MLHKDQFSEREKEFINKNVMVNAQKWLDENYPKTKRNEVEEIYLSEPNLEGELDLGDFTYLNISDYGAKVYISHYLDESKLDIKNKREKTEIIKLVKVQTYIDQKYLAKGSKEQLTELFITNQKLEGELILSSFPNLKKLNCSSNKLNILNLKNCYQLEDIGCYNNKLTNLDVSDCSCLTKLQCSDNLLGNLFLPINHSTNLKELSLSDNNFPDQNLLFLAKVTNLEKIWLSNYDKERIIQDIYNKFTGSLNYLSGMKQLKELDISNTDLNEIDADKLPDSLENVYYSTEKRPTSKLTEIISQLQKYEWKDVCSEFTLRLRRSWEKTGLNKEQTWEWINVGTKPSDCNFISYLREVRQITPQKFLNNKNSDEYQELRKKLNKYSWCSKCRQVNISENWCHACAEKAWNQNLEWLTGQQLIEKFIQQQQVSNKGTYINKLRWIPYEQFTDIKYLTKGGFGKVYKAVWKRKNKYSKYSQNIVLKSLNNSQNIKFEFLTEVANNKLVDNNKLIVTCFGISQDPKVKDYMMVMDYMKDGSLCQYLQQKNRNLSWQDKLCKLSSIAQGLYIIHDQGLVHRDFHPGNILNKDEKNVVDCYIADLGLSKPANFQSEEEKIYGVLPYVASEVLCEKQYTQASDIYSFGMVTYELLSYKPPYHNIAHNEPLAIWICNGLRPPLNNIKAPQLLKDLISKCWDADPKKRPTASEIKKISSDWYNKINSFVIGYDENSEFYRQCKEIEEAEKSDKTSSSIASNLNYQTHPQAIYTSRLLDFKNLPKPQNSEEINEEFWKSPSMKFDVSKLQKELEEMDEHKNNNWTSIHPDFTDKLSKKWQNLDFNYNQCKELMDIGLKPNDYNFCAWLRDVKQVDNVWVLNHGQEQELRAEYQIYQQYQQEQLQDQIQIPPKRN